MQPLIDGSLPDAERLRAQTHLDECAGCRARVAFWESVSRTLRDNSPDGPAHPDRMWRQVEATLAQKSSPAPRPLWPMFAPLGFAAAMAVALVVWLRTSPPQAPSMRIVASGDAAYDVHTDATETRYELAHGTLSLAVTDVPAGSTVSICTPQSCARVFGTVFSVSYDGEVERVSVQSGVVGVSTRETPDQLIVMEAGEALEPPWQPRRQAARATAAELAHRADRYLAARDLLHAQQTWLQITREYPRSNEAESALYQLGRYTANHQHFQRYLRDYPRGLFAADAEWQLALRAIEQKRMRDATRHLEHLVATQRSSPQWGPAAYALATIYASSNKARAIQLFEAYRALPSAPRKDEATMEIERLRR